MKVETALVTTTVKQTVSVKQRAEGGDEVFISVGQEISNVPLDEADAYKAKLDASISEWLEARVSAVAGAAFDSYSDPDEGEAETEADEDEDGDELTYEDVAKMKAAELKALIEEYELEVDPKLKVKELREAVLEALFADGDEDEDEADEDEDEADEDEDEADEDEDEDGEEDEPYTEDELKAMKLAELTEIAEAWEIEVELPKKADLKAKKSAYIAAILEFQEEAEE